MDDRLLLRPRFFDNLVVYARYRAGVFRLHHGLRKTPLDEMTAMYFEDMQRCDDDVRQMALARCHWSMGFTYICYREEENEAGLSYEASLALGVSYDDVLHDVPDFGTAILKR